MVTECRRIDPCKTVACEQLVCKEHEILIFSKGECCPKCLPAEGNCKFPFPDVLLYTLTFSWWI